MRGAQSSQDAPLRHACVPGSTGLSYNPWHSIAEHRPLGNQSRARHRMYFTLSQLRHQLNAVPHYEPTGDETFS